MEQNACVYGCMQIFMCMCECVCLYKNTPYNDVLITMQVSAQVHMDV